MLKTLALESIFTVAKLPSINFVDKTKHSSVTLILFFKDYVIISGTLLLFIIALQ